MLKQCLKNKAHFPLRHSQNIILTEPQPKKAKLPCCIRKAKLFYLMLDEDSNNISPSASSIRDLGTRLPILKGFLWKNYQGFFVPFKHDLNLFKLNALEDTNPGDSLYNHRIHSRYYSPYSFYKFKSELPSRVSDSSFSLLHNNIKSLKRNLENFQVHLLDELNFEFSIIGVSETKTISGKEMDFNPSIPGYVFEYVPTPLASGGVGLYINDSLKQTVIEKVSDEAFQSLWIEIQLPQKSNIICGIIYRQHNSPKRFQEYFDDKLERLITSKKSIYIMGDFNINLLHAANFLLCSGLLTFSSKLFIYPNY